MAVTTQTNHSLVVSLDGTDYACQVIDASFTPPGIGSSTITETACPDGVVAEPGSISNGSLTGTVFADSGPTGITWALAQAYEANAELAYIFTAWPDLVDTGGMVYTGTGRVASFQIDFSKPGVGKHPLNLEIPTAALTRPPEDPGQ